MTTQTEVQRAPFDLFIGHDETGQTGSMIRVRWCLSPEMARQLKEDKVLNPCMLIVITDDEQHRELARYVFPLTQEFAIISLSHAGKSTLHATIVWLESDGSVKRYLENRDDLGDYRVVLTDYRRQGAQRLHVERELLYQDKSDLQSRFDYSHPDYEKSKAIESHIRQIDQQINQMELTYGIRENFDLLRRVDHEFSVDIDVPAAMFAPEPPKITKWLSELYPWRHSPRDQCERRKRAYFITLPTLPFAAIAAAIVAVAVAVLWVACKFAMLVVIVGLNIWGSRGIDYQPFLRPSSIDVSDIWFGLKPSIWWTKNAQTVGGMTSYPKRHLIFEIINPPGVLAVILVCWLATRGEGSIEWWTMLVIVLAIWSVVALLVQSRRSPKVVEKQTKTELTVLAQKLDTLTCTLPGTREASLAALPMGRRTLHLRFLDMKRKVCRPYAK